MILENYDDYNIFKPTFRAYDIRGIFNENLTPQSHFRVGLAWGTFLQNESYMDVFYREGYTIIEMEIGPYLSSIYEMVRPQRFPRDQLINLNNIPFPIGVLHYASDTPFSKGKNLGAQNLSYFGMDPTYATMTAIMRQILRNEIEHLS